MSSSSLPRPGSGYRLLAAVVGIVLVVAMALDTEYRKAGEVSASGREAFDADAFGRERFPEIAAAVQESAVPLAELLPALAEDQDAASERFGKRQGSSPYNFPTTGEGVAGAPEAGLLPVEVEGVPAGTTVSVQIGPAINGTALRDVTGEIEFGQFTNQVEYAGAATALNTQVKEQVVQDLDASSLEGERVRFTGAFTLLAPTAVTITPTEFEVVG